MQELKDLYLSLENMEYFPIECKMTGSFKLVNNIPSLFVSDFEILHIEKEFESTVKTLLRIVGSDQLLSDNTKLSLSLSRRQPYLDPLNYIQVML